MFVYWFSWVSVSLRSIIHSYGVSYKEYNNLIGMIVSVSLRSIIHSYLKNNFCLGVIVMIYVSVSLRSIIHSYGKKYVESKGEKVEFPSPYGVSLILMLKILCMV